MEQVQRAIRCGISSVMIDAASSEHLEDNIQDHKRSLLM